MCNAAQRAHNNLIVITTIDATKETGFSHPCPKVCVLPRSVLHHWSGRLTPLLVQVSPNSAIYFYQFTSSSSTEKLWTTRFTITDEEANSTPPTETTQPNGDKIPWGTGKIIEESGSVPGPSSDLSSLSTSSSSGLPGSGSSRSGPEPSSSRLTSTRTPAPTQTSVNTGSSQGSSNGDMAVAVPKALVFVIALVTASTAFFL